MPVCRRVSGSSLAHVAKLLAIGVLGALVALSVSAASHGILEIRVSASNGEPLDGVAIEVSSVAMIGRRTAATGPSGTVVFAGLPPGTYRLACTRATFADAARVVELAQDQRLEVPVTMQPEGVRDEIEVRAPHLLVDTRTATVAEHVHLEQAAALPVGRDYRAYAQLVAGVNVVPNSDGLEPRYEPASKAGNFYHDRGAQLGSRDNTYYLDGFDFTGIGSGTGELLFDVNTLAHQEVMTSLPSAEYAGGAGYVVNLVTKTGGRSFAGSAEMFVQTPSMQEEYDTPDTRLHTPEEDSWDAGVTLGGPLWPDRLWFFAGAQWREQSDDVHLSDSASPMPLTTSFRLKQQPAMLKLTARPAEGDSLSLVAYRDPREILGSRNVNTPPNRFSKLDDTFVAGTLSYHRQVGRSLLAEGRLIGHRRRAQGLPLDVDAGPTNTILYEPGLQVPAYLRDLGSSGGGGATTHRKRQGAASASRFFESAGSHQLELGFAYERWEEEVANDPFFDVTFTSIAPHLRGITFEQARSFAFLPASELDTVLRELRNMPDSAAFRAADRNGDGAVTEDELASVAFTSSAGNPGGINFLRNQILVDGVNNVGQDTHVLYAQDDWRLRRWAFTLGVRAEDRIYVASDGSTILDMDPVLYPRLGVAYDVGGAGRHRLSLAYGTYPDPLRSSMLRFAGSFSGSIGAEQIFLGDDWFTYRLTGAATRPREASFAPGLENELEEEYQLTYGANVVRDYGVLVQLFRRRDYNIIEDYDPNLYLNPTAAGDFALTPGDFGFPSSGPGAVAFFLANLVGGERRTYGADLSLTRRYTGNWSGSFQYSWRDAEGNSNSDGAADLQGDFLDVDPRHSYMWGDLPGTIPHQVKVYGTYRAPFGLEIGGLFYWNSGAVFTESTIWRPTSHGIYYNHQRVDGTYARTGAEQHPGYWTQDVRLTYPVERVASFSLALTLDVVNLFDHESALRVMEAHNDPEFSSFRATRQLLIPRRYQLGVRARL